MNFKKNQNFRSEDLKVDWLSFKFQTLEDSQAQKIADYLVKIGFNCYQESVKFPSPIKKSVCSRLENKFEALFVKEAPYWQGTLVQFSGRNALMFYNLVEKNKIDWTIFSSGIMNRLDIYYCRTHKKTDKLEPAKFLENCQKKINKKTQLEKNFKGFILKIGSRRSNNYLRIYEGKNSLKFEQEMKGKFLQEYHTLLIENKLEEFEKKLSSHFLLSFGKILPLNCSYLDWLVTNLRPIRKQPSFKYGLNSDYIKTQILVDTKTFINLIQFLNYAQNLDFEIQYLDSVAYRKVIFELRDFLEFQDPNTKLSNYYQLNKLKEFFSQLQAGLYVTSFSDTYYQSLVIVPQVQFEKCPDRKLLLVKVWLVEELFYHNYPFYFPNFFQKKLKNYQLEVAFKFYQIFTSIDIEKEFLIEEFIKSYPASLSNQQKTEIKKYFIELVEKFKEADLIESKYKILTYEGFRETKRLTPKNISKGFLVYEKLLV